MSLTRPKIRGDIRNKDRGFRNYNPGNIRHSNSNWVGMSEHQTDPDFVQFESMAYGVRALAKILLTYQRKDGCKTLADIISRWAPPSENNTKAYIASVSQYMPHCSPNIVLDFQASDHIDLFDIVEAIVDHENFKGAYVVIKDDITNGVVQALA